MKSINFEETNIVYAKDQKQYKPLCGHKDTEGVATFCFKLSEDEILEIIKTGHIWFQFMTFNHPLQPIAPTTNRPDTFKPVVSSESEVDMANNILAKAIDKIFKDD
jgi:hypothetical protein